MHYQKIYDGKQRAVSFVELFQKYLSLRCLSIESSQLFLGTTSGKCSRRNINVNTFGSMPRKIAKYLKLLNPCRYTGH